MADVSYQSLYRRYRPQRFDELLGQEPVSRALRNAVREGRVAHAYLFSGPRGTGKTSAARILAKALNCTAVEDGEPCGRCESCLAVAAGTSLDVHELDAASNNGVEAMRDLVARAGLGTPGRSKVYIVDEVHMLSTAASNALLKTLEEPPAHVVFVLATTDAQKVLPTIRSRTQHFEFKLLGRDVLSGLLEEVSRDAGLGVDREGIELAVRRGQGSARDALSALDQVAASGIVESELPTLDEMLEALASRDSGRALLAASQALAAGRDAQRVAGDLIAHLRQGFLALLAPDLVVYDDEEAERVAEQGRRLGLAALVRAMEVLGRAQVDMRDALDPRVSLEVALVRLTHPEADSSPEALAERLERLERAAHNAPVSPRGGAPVSPTGVAPVSARGGAPTTPRGGEGPPSSPAGAGGVDPATPGGSIAGNRGGQGGGAPTSPKPADGARAVLDSVRSARGASPATPSAEAASPPVPPAPPGSPSPGAAPGSTSAGSAPVGGDLEVAPVALTRDEVVKAWGDQVLRGLRGRARALYQAGRFVAVVERRAVFALPGETHKRHCEECRPEVEQALSAHFGLPVALDLQVETEDQGVGDPSAFEEEALDRADLGAPVAGVTSVEERLLEAFPGAKEVTP